MRSRICFTDTCRIIETRVKDLLNSHSNFLSYTTAQSPRAVGDAIQEIVAENLGRILANDCAEYSASFARRAMADLAFKDIDGLYYVVDVKTHRADTFFNMPNLTSVERLARFYEDDANYFAILMIKYQIQETKAAVSEVTFVPVEFLAWECLNIGALGWGNLDRQLELHRHQSGLLPETVDDRVLRHHARILPEGNRKNRRAHPQIRSGEVVLAGQVRRAGVTSKDSSLGRVAVGHKRL